jgi:carbon storage regulator
MLVLARKENETIRIHAAGGISITVCRIQGHQVWLGIEAPRSVPIVRGELAARVADAGTARVADAGTASKGNP